MNGIPATVASAVIGVVLAVVMLVLATLTVIVLTTGRIMATVVVGAATAVRRR